MDLKDLRQQIDSIDDTIVEAYAKRLSLTRQVGQYKKQNSVPIEHNDREKQILDRLTAKAGSQNKIAVEYLYNAIMTYSKMEQTILNAENGSFDIKKSQTDFANETSVGLAGAVGAYAEKAARQLFSKMQPTFYAHFGDVFKAVDDGKIKYGVVPIENSTAGSVNEVYDLLKDYNIKIVGATRLTVNHCLFGTSDSTLEDIKKVYSHPQALYQCKKFLSAHNVEAIEDSNTAVACKKVAEMADKTVGAIGAKSNKNIKGLKLLKNDLQDETYNFTRFIVIAKQMAVPEDANKLSLMLSIKHKPGTLYQLLSILSSFKVNLHKLESRPLPEQKFEFMFYLDIECDVFSEDTKAMLACVSGYAETMTVLGAYKEVI